MDTDLKCNRLNCRRALNDKAVNDPTIISVFIPSCRFLFTVDCANELFGAARLCPACETSLTEPCVPLGLLRWTIPYNTSLTVCSLHPTNDYKTSVLSGLNPSTILEICSRAVSFWQYQIHQENSFQQAVLRNLNDKIAILQKQLDNVVREANGEINLLSNKVLELERDAEVERRKIRDMQDAAKERDKEYQKLKVTDHSLPTPHIPLLPSAADNLLCHRCNYRANTTKSSAKPS
ncbi:uncharacterized protein STEHIDRAFT_54448 [Stereum hirsutum FP-91666 SS1]|uniref:uncharacterized protein n=1 Tax=Stereum hirsutum (strain FP-91666) TaxID=721885 RepID=UPI000440DF33|nr:uncharacterized protein STEHIDRAFT_54448 [Stereum hirsutum FP-91666 SS1]EIM88500.1 hypothetical protein STEHIDRAFT_54448 [Stereum hirsutum FP-91666 SS1]